MKPDVAHWLAPMLAATLAACGPTGASQTWLDTVAPVENPALPGSRYPHLAAGGGQLVMSWLQALPQGGFALQHARWRDAAWEPAATVTQGEDWFVNWADFPSVVPMGDNTLAAHWLQQKPGSVYSYDVRMAVSTDDGATWSAPMSPHDDGTLTEHGFVTVFEAGDGIRAVWLDGRHTGGGHDHAGAASGAMTLRTALLGPDGLRVGPDREIDARVCDCCQTDAVLSADGPIVVYRDRGTQEIRDIAVVRLADGRWSEPVHVHEDGWKIDACPVNGPAIDAHGRTVAVAWFTGADVPRVRLAFSQDAGRTFSRPIEVANGDVTGRVDVVLLDDGRAVVSWLQPSATGAEIRAQPFDGNGAAGTQVVIAASSVQRASGFPQMVRAGTGLLFAWTDAGEPAQVRTAYATLL
jgi:hypothetical protein